MGKVVESRFRGKISSPSQDRLQAAQQTDVPANKGFSFTD
jgi:hypothetical protein